MDPKDLTPDKLAGLVERLILEQQRYEPLELLLAAGVIAYPDYEAWRLGHRPVLQSALRLPLAETLALLRQAEAQAHAAGLIAAAADFRRWGEDPVPLELGPSLVFRRALAAVCTPPADRRQLDLFYDSGGAVLEEALRDALLARRFGAARAAADKLRQHNPDHMRIGDWLRLIDLLEQSPRKAGAEPSWSGAAARLRDIEAIIPIAASLLGQRARDALALLWAELARATDGLAFDPAEPRLHASYPLARLGRWQDVRAVIETEPGWREAPQLLERHARACKLGGDTRAALATWLALCWSHPDTAERVLAASDFPDSRLAARWTAFCDLDLPADSDRPAAPALETEDFPAWCLLVDPTLAAEAPADPATEDPDRAAAYHAALALAKAPDDLDRRRALGAAHPTLLATFLRRRRSGY